MPVLRQGERPLQGRQLLLTPDEGRQPLLRLDLQPGQHPLGPHDLPCAHGLLPVLHGDAAEGPGLEVAVDEAVGGFGHDDLARLGDLLHPGGQVRRVADGRVVHPEVVADGADHHEAGIETDPHPEVHAALPPEPLAVVVEGALDLERRVHGALGVVLVGDGRAEERHEAVPEKLVRRTLEPVDGPQHQLEGAVHEVVHLLGIQFLRDGREPRHVGEKDRDLLPLALERPADFENFLRQVGGSVGAG